MSSCTSPRHHAVSFLRYRKAIFAGTSVYLTSKKSAHALVHQQPLLPHPTNLIRQQSGGNVCSIASPATVATTFTSYNGMNQASRLFSAATTGERETMFGHAQQIVDAAIQAVNPYSSVMSHFQLDKESGHLLIGKEREVFALDDYDRIVLTSFGKASSAMASAVLQQLSSASRPVGTTSGVVICKDDHCSAEEKELLNEYDINVRMASHPIPDQRSADGAEAILDLVKNEASPSTLVICCISGGGSALFCQPQDGLTLRDLQDVSSVLLSSGMGIQDMNVIRKRLETGKGGRLAAACGESQLLTLVLSDVLGDPLDLIASGPTVPDSSTWTDAWDLVTRYDLMEKFPERVIDLLAKGNNGEMVDSPTFDLAVFERSRTVLVGNNALAVDAAAKCAKALGYKPVVLGTQIQGEAREMAHMYTGMAQYLQEESSGSFTSMNLVESLPAALIAGGETTVSLPDDAGRGGRNQELALSAALQLESMDLHNVVLASVGTDGTDGPTDAAGAVVDASTVDGSLSEARIALSKHDAYTYFDSLQEQSEHVCPLIKTGPTGTNVADICVTLVGAQRPKH